MEKLKKGSCDPLYQQIVDDIKQRIGDGKIKRNSKLMTEAELSEFYNVSRITVRKAVEILVEERILIKKQGIGTFVSEKRLERNLTSVLGFTENCEQAGSVAGAELLDAGLVRVDKEIVKKLQLNVEQAIRIRRIRYCDNVPVMLEENFYSPQFSFLLAEDLNKSIHKILKKNGIIPRKCKKEISTCQAGKEGKKYLDVNEKEALLYIKDLCYDSEGKPLYVSVCKINSLVYTLNVYV